MPNKIYKGCVEPAQAESIFYYKRMILWSKWIKKKQQKNKKKENRKKRRCIPLSPNEKKNKKKNTQLHYDKVRGETAAKQHLKLAAVL